MIALYLFLCSIFCHSSYAAIDTGSTLNLTVQDFSTYCTTIKDNFDSNQTTLSTAYTLDTQEHKDVFCEELGIEKAIYNDYLEPLVAHLKQQQNLINPIENIFPFFKKLAKEKDTPDVYIKKSALLLNEVWHYEFNLPTQQAVPTPRIQSLFAHHFAYYIIAHWNILFPQEYTKKSPLFALNKDLLEHIKIYLPLIFAKTAKPIQPLLFYKPPTPLPQATSLTCSADEQYMAYIRKLGSHDNHLTFIYLHDPKTKEYISSFIVPNDTSSIVFSPDSNKIAAYTISRSFCIYNLKGHILSRLDNYETPCFAFYPDSDSIIFPSSTDVKLHIWNTKTQEIHTLIHNQLVDINGIIQCIAPCVKQKTIACGLDTGIVLLWNIQKNTQECIYSSHSKEKILHIAYASEKNHVAFNTSTCTLFFYDIASKFLTCRKITENLKKIALSADDAHLFTLSETGCLALWTSTIGHCIKRIGGANNPVARDFTLLPRATHIITAHHDTLDIWNITAINPSAEFWKKSFKNILKKDFYTLSTYINHFHQYNPHAHSNRKWYAWLGCTGLMSSLLIANVFYFLIFKIDT